MYAPRPMHRPRDEANRQIKYLRVPDEIIDQVSEAQKSQGNFRGRGQSRGDRGDRGRGGRGRGRGRGRGQ